VRPLIAVALFTLLLAVLPATAQIHAIPPSVTSMGPRGQFSPVPFPSVTSPGPLGAFGSPFLTPERNLENLARFRRHRHLRLGSGLGVPVYIPYPSSPLFYPFYPFLPGAYDPATEGVSAAAEPGWRDRNLPAATPPPSYGSPQVNSAAADGTRPAPVPNPPPPPEQEPTILVFRDGNRLTVRNYAIVGSYLYNFSGAGPRKIALSSLDLDSTIRVNDERGILFNVPLSVSVR
jgi:hypothetical protein